MATIGRPSEESVEEAFLSGRHYEAMRIMRFAAAEAKQTDQRPEAANKKSA